MEPIEIFVLLCLGMAVAMILFALMDETPVSRFFERHFNAFRDTLLRFRWFRAFVRFLERWLA